MSMFSRQPVFHSRYLLDMATYLSRLCNVEGGWPKNGICTNAISMPNFYIWRGHLYLHAAANLLT